MKDQTLEVCLAALRHAPRASNFIRDDGMREEAVLAHEDELRAALLTQELPRPRG